MSSRLLTSWSDDGDAVNGDVLRWKFNCRVEVLNFSRRVWELGTVLLRYSYSVEEERGNPSYDWRCGDTSTSCQCNVHS